MRPEQDEIIEKLFRAHFNELEIHAYRYLGDWNQAQIAAQDAFHTACEKIDDLMDSPNPIGWLKNTVRNTARNMIKIRNRQIKLFFSIEELSYEALATVPDETTTDLMEECAKLVSETDLYLLKRIAVDGASYIEMAEELGITMWACRKRVQRTILKLQKGLQENWEK